MREAETNFDPGVQDSAIDDPGTRPPEEKGVGDYDALSTRTNIPPDFLERSLNERRNIPPQNIDIRTTEDALRWFVGDLNASDYHQAMMKVLGRNASDSQIRGEIKRVLDGWVNSPREDNFITASGIVPKLYKVDPSLGKEFVLKLLGKFFSHQTDLDKLKKGSRDEVPALRVAQAIAKIEIAAIKIAGAKIHLIKTLLPDLEDERCFRDVEERNSAIRAVRAGLSDVLPYYPDKVNITDYGYPQVYRACFLYGSQDQKEIARRKLSRVKSGDRGRINLADNEIFQLATDENDAVRSEAMDIIIQHLESYFGIGRQAFLVLANSWRASIEEDFTQLAFRENINQIEFLESQRPGITLALIDQYGINVFARYPAKALIWQFDHRQKPNLTYGLLVFPREDHNGAFFDNVDLLGDLFDDMVEDGQRWGGFIIIEADNKLAMVRRMNAVRKASGSAAFGIIGGHGTDRTIQFGRQFDRGGELKIEDVSKMVSIAARYRQSVKTGDSAPPLFKEGSTVILNSCSTGLPSGIGSKISELTNGAVIAPTVPTALRSIRFVPPTGTGGYSVPSFEVGYQKEGQGVMFKSGKNVGSQ